MVKYYDKKDQLSGKKRICEICEETVLSRYNDSKICSLCQKREEARRNAEITSMMKSLGLDGD